MVKGAVDVVLRRGVKPMLIVAGETVDAVASVKTCLSGGKLMIEREGMTISFGNSRMIFHGTFLVGNIVNGKPLGPSIIGPSIIQAKVAVGIALPKASAVKIKGGSDVSVFDLRQAGLEMEIEGSGDFTAYGQVTHLDVEIAGSGDVDASELIADCASLSVAGSGGIETFIRFEVRARVARFCDILVRGNSPHRDHSVADSGKNKFR